MARAKARGMSRRLSEHRRGARRRRQPQPYNLFDSYDDDDLDLDEDEERPTRRLSAWDEVESDDDTFTDSLWNDDDVDLEVEVDEDED